jgi:2-keto-4-pentenoate hydratase/2-oxohepta-3-ene-1,7-dioic acid hydratase in catechol pathway
MNLFWENGEALPWPTRKIVCVGRNYQAHAKELNNPIPKQPFFFIKPSTTLTAFNGTWAYPTHLGPVHYELELALLIGTPLDARLYNNTLLNNDDIRKAIAGYGLALDLTLRETQNQLKAQGLPWEQAKAFDTACPISTFQAINHGVPGEEIEAALKLIINGDIRQQGSTQQMIFSPYNLIKAAVQYFSLEPGDIILTGTPEGVGELIKGQQLTASLQLKQQTQPALRCSLSIQ